MVSVKHKFASGKSDSTDASIVRPSNWNEEHAFVMAANRLLGRFQTGVGPVQEIVLSDNFTFENGVLDVSISFEEEVEERFDEKADKTIQITAGVGLSGGGDLSANRTFAVILDTDAAAPLTAATLNAVTAKGHTHKIDTLSVVSKGNSLIAWQPPGAFCMLRFNGGNNVLINDEKAGTDLTTSNGGGTNPGSHTPPGRWRCMSAIQAGGTNGSNSGVWVRIS